MLADYKNSAMVGTPTSSDDELETPVSSSLGGSPATPPSFPEFERSKESQTRRINIPYRGIFPHKENVSFTGRSDVLANIHDSLRPDRPPAKRNTQAVFALCGLGGVGKTQVAIRYAMDNFSDSYQAVFFAHADEPRNLLADFARFSVDLGIVDPNESDDLHSCEQLRKWLVETSKPRPFVDTAHLVLTCLQVSHGS